MRGFLQAVERRALVEREERLQTTRGVHLPKAGPDVRKAEVPDLCAETQRQLQLQREARKVLARRLVAMRDDGVSLAEAGECLGLTAPEVEALWAFVRRGGAQ